MLGSVQIDFVSWIWNATRRLKRDLRELRRVNLDLRRRLAQLSMSRPNAEAMAAPAVTCWSDIALIAGISLISLFYLFQVSHEVKWNHVKSFSSQKFEDEDDAVLDPKLTSWGHVSERDFFKGPVLA